VLRTLLYIAALWGGPALAQDAERGAALAAMGGCAACHTAPDGAPLAGGFSLETPYGTFYGSNITPDPTAGLGRWTYPDFERAMREGRSPDGRNYWPAFPFTSFTKLTDADLADLWAWLQAQPADPTPSLAQDPKPKVRGMLGMWRSLAFPRKVRGAYTPDPSQSDAWNRGAYLGEGILHCGGCHTPRNRTTGAEKRGHALAGSTAPPEPAPNIARSGLPQWTHDDWTSFFAWGMTRDGDVVGGEMYRIVEEGTAILSADDQHALATWLLSVGDDGAR